MENNENEPLSSFALNALSDAEREEVLRHAATSEPTRQELDELQKTAALLSLAAPAVQPPERLKTNIMDAIRTTEQLPPDPGETQSEPLEPEPSSPPHPVHEDGRVEKRRSGKAQKFFALAAGILLVVAGGLGAAVWKMSVQQQEHDAQMQALSSERNNMMKILRASDMKSKSQTLDDGGKVRISYSAESGLMTVSTTGMAELPKDKGYELWLISDDGATPAGMLDLSDDSGTKIINGSMEDVTHFGITVEPAKGSKEPTTDPILLQSL